MLQLTVTLIISLPNADQWKNSRRRSIVKDEVQYRFPQITEHRTRRTLSLRD